MFDLLHIEKSNYLGINLSFSQPVMFAKLRKEQDMKKERSACVIHYFFL